MTTKYIPNFIRNTALLLGFAVFFYACRDAEENRVFIYAMPIQTEWGWGYKIYRSSTQEKDTSVDKVYIKQEYMPGIPGKKGFASSADALRVADLVIKRIGSNHIPTISEKDLDSLGLLNKH